MNQEEFHKRYQYNPNTACLGEGGFGKVYKAYEIQICGVKNCRSGFKYLDTAFGKIEIALSKMKASQIRQ